MLEAVHSVHQVDQADFDGFDVNKQDDVMAVLGRSDEETRPKKLFQVLQ